MLGAWGATVGASPRYQGSWWQKRAPWGALAALLFVAIVALVATGRADSWAMPIVDLLVSLFALFIINACADRCANWPNGERTLLVRVLSSRALVYLGGFSYSPIWCSTRSAFGREGGGQAHVDSRRKHPASPRRRRANHDRHRLAVRRAVRAAIRFRWHLGAGNSPPPRRREHDSSNNHGVTLCRRPRRGAVRITESFVQCFSSRGRFFRRELFPERTRRDETRRNDQTQRPRFGRRHAPCTRN